MTAPRYRGGRVALVGAALLVPRTAYAHDCSGFVDCYATLIVAAVVIVALALFIALTWEMWAVAIAIDAEIAEGALLAEGAAELEIEAVAVDEGLAVAEAAEEEVTTTLSEPKGLIQKYLDKIKNINWIDGKTNCVKLAQATDKVLAGSESELFSVINEETGASAQALADEMGETLTETSFDGIATELSEGGSGSRGIVNVGKYVEIDGQTVWRGHVFNAINDEGYVVFIDSQSRTVALNGAEVAAKSGWVGNYVVRFIPTLIMP
jgi:hypothetical protein